VADVFVRGARAADVADIARIQVLTWRTAYRGLLPDQVLDGLDDTAVEARWDAAVRAAPSPLHRVLVAVEADAVVGFAAAGPADQDDVETPAGAPLHDPDRTVVMGTVLVEPRWGRRGHGSRLLAAVVDLARGDGLEHAVTWVLEGDAASAGLLGSAGWAPDGTARRLEAPGGTVVELRWHASLAEEAVDDAGD